MSLMSVAVRDGEAPVGEDRLCDLVVDPTGDAYECVMRAMDRAQLLAAVDQLGAVDSRIMRWRYGLDGEEMTLRQVGGRLNMNASTVLRRESAALAQLHDLLVGQGFTAEALCA